MTDTPDFLSYYSAVKILPDGRYAGIYSFMFTDAIIVGKLDVLGYYDDRWCYEKGAANHFLEVWGGVGEPNGWHRHPDTGRRRPGGDPFKEYINF